MLARQIVALLAFAAPLPALATQDTSAAESPARLDSLKRQFESRLHWETGKITLKSGLATLDVPDGFRFLGPKDAELVLTKAWGNPPGTEPLGMIFPAAMGPLDDDSWGVVITYDEDGYVKDDEAAKLDYTELLKTMQKAVLEGNEERKKAGFGTVRLIGWAEPPHYDRESHKLFWAKELQFSAAEHPTLNYNIRALGRRGVLVLNAVAGMDQLDSVKSAMPQVLAFVNFSEGNRYADFNASKGDKVAAYGIAALIAGGVAAKAGLLKGLLVALLAAKKFLIIAAAGAAAWFRKFFNRGKSTATAAAPGAPPPKP